MEEPFSLATTDGKQIYGVLHTPSTPSSCVVILVHGLIGNMREFLHITFARHLAQHGIAVIRFNQYDDEKDARRFDESTISLHVQDTKTVVAYARERGFSKVVLIGHSLGAPVAIAATDATTHGLLLWDPGASPSERVTVWETKDSDKKISYLDWRMKIILGSNWIADAKTFPDSFKQLTSLTLPVKIIAAGLGGHGEHCARYRAALAREHAYAVIPAADHQFTTEGAIEKLIEESASWIMHTFGGTL